MLHEDLHVLILAAGKGTRLRSQMPKVLHKVGGLSLLEHALKTTQALQATSVGVVISPDQQEIAALLQEKYSSVQVVVQKEQKGTADAVLASRAHLEGRAGTLLILFADVPLLKPETLRTLSQKREEEGASLTLLALEAPGHPGYGRLILDSDNQVARIVEMKEACEAEKKESLCNSSLMACQVDHLVPLLEKVTPHNKGGEYYLTDIVALAKEQGQKVTYLTASDPREVMAVNTRQELAEVESALQTHLREQAMDQGVTLLDPATVYFSYDTQLSEDVVVYPHVHFGPGVTVESKVTLHGFSHLEGVHIQTGASVGPYARLRPGTVLAEGARVGNFVELKKTSLGKGSKVNHLSYLGDTSVGDDCNIGAGTITCNYDGSQKHATVLERGTFIGSHTTLVAPLTVQQGAYVGAGSVLTKDVSPEALALSRVPQVEREGGARLLRRRRHSSSSKASRKGVS